jgi:WD40 repeat protein
MRQFTLAQLLMMMPLVAIVITLVKSEGCGWPNHSVVSSVTFSPDGRRIAVAKFVARRVNEDFHNFERDVRRTISVVDLDSGAPPVVVERTFLPIGPILSCSRRILGFGPEGHSLLVREIDRRGEIVWAEHGVRRYDLSTGHAGPRVVSGGSFSMAVSADGALVASGYFDRVVLLDSLTGKEVWQARATEAFPLLAPLLAFSADGKIVAAAGSGGVFLLDVRDGSLIRRLANRKDQGWLAGIAFSPVGHVLATDFEKALQVDDLDSGKHSELGVGHNAVAFSPDGKKLAITQPNGVVIVDWATGGTVAAVDVPGDLTSLAYSPKDDLIAIGNDQGELALWRVAEGQNLHWISLPGGSGYPWTSWPVPTGLLVVWFFIFRRLSRKTGQSREDNGGMTGTTPPFGESIALPSQ